jgi:hypothetical protein
MSEQLILPYIYEMVTRLPVRLDTHQFHVIHDRPCFWSKARDTTRLEEMVIGNNVRRDARVLHFFALLQSISYVARIRRMS